MRQCMILLLMLICIMMVIVINKKEYFETITQQDIFNKNKSDNLANNAYNELLEKDREGIIYYNNDYNNFDDIPETSENIIMNTDNRDYSVLKESGYSKCVKNCDGLCTTWYDGNAVCYPLDRLK